MDNNKQNRTIEQIEQESKTLFSGGGFRWEKSDANVWAEMEKAMDAASDKKVRRVNFAVVRYAVAAVVVLLLGVTAFLRFYTQTIEALPGQHLAHVLPDGSKVEMNADSKLSYQPYWWIFSRKLKFEGEGFFEVEKGEKFRVESEIGITEVLGTSFNIYAREKEYRVTCYTGKIKVTSVVQEEVILKPDDHVTFDDKGEVKIKDNFQPKDEISWIEDLFIFTATPLDLVLEEIERQYNITIHNQQRLKLYFTGNFNKAEDVESVLDLVCKPLNIKYKKVDQHTFSITQ